MKALFILLTLFSFSASASEEFVCETVHILGKEHEDMLSEISSGIKSGFKRRHNTSKNYTLALFIDTNFEVPLLGKEKYFGFIYFKKNDREKIWYRDEMIAQKYLKTETQDPDKYYQRSYSVSDINSSKGLALIDMAGAEVILKSDGKFSTSTGGLLYLKVKPPGGDPFNLKLEVEVKDGKITNYIHKNGKRIAFDTLRINAKTNVFGSPSILSGIDNIQFFQGNRVAASIKQ